uniref:frizzled-9-like n=1 Tax=Myxine glutinosa TaxID=7769 RepID=UPI00358E61B2
MAAPQSVASALFVLFVANLCTCVARQGLARSDGYPSNVPLRGSGFERPRTPGSRCEAIEIPLCRNIGYNLTSMPNLLGHEVQVEAAVHLHEFATLIEFGCHVHIRFFLCSVFAPMCTEQVSQPIPACRPMCEHTRDTCAPIMRKFSFGWPDSLRCDRLPTKHDPNALCMEAPVDPSEREPPSGRRFTEGLPLGPMDLESRPSPGATCPNPGKMTWAPRSGRCAPRCLPGVDYLWTSSDRVLARACLLPLSSLCLASCVFTLLTFVLEPARFGYPERPVAFLAASYGVHAATFLGALMVGAERVSCQHAPDGSLYRIQVPTCTAPTHTAPTRTA